MIKELRDRINQLLAENKRAWPRRRRCSICEQNAARAAVAKQQGSETDVAGGWQLPVPGGTQYGTRFG